MNEKDLINAMNSLDDDILINARKTSEKRVASKRWLAPVIAAAIIIICVVAVFLISSAMTRNRVVYAEELSLGELLDSSDKVVISDSVKALKSSVLVRVAIAVHEVYETGIYPELGFSWDNDHSYDDYLDYVKRFMHKEQEFLESIGATDFAGPYHNYIICTISTDNIPKLEQGKCGYTVVMFTANDNDINKHTLSSYSGTYASRGCVYMPSVSSFVPYTAEQTKDSYITVDNDSISLGLGFYPANKKNGVYSCRQISEEDLSDREKSLIDPEKLDRLELFLFGNKIYYAELLYSPKTIYEAVNSDGRHMFYIYITQYGIYIDFNLAGIYLFN